MKLLLIHGPPGVGKLAVAKELSKLTGFKMFHNHLTCDYVESIFSNTDKNFWKLISKIRLLMVKNAVEEKLWWKRTIQKSQRTLKKKIQKNNRCTTIKTRPQEMGFSHNTSNSQLTRARHHTAFSQTSSKKNTWVYLIRPYWSSKSL